ncbi:hypothetical protein BVI2075_100019 [Burkholderia vietnamiensis]|nr:hypothetical protein BVI2075_100019 [Burkholderia vietnamiensis]
MRFGEATRARRADSVAPRCVAALSGGMKRAGINAPAASEKARALMKGCREN